jgi:hypothetical protein
VYTTDTNKQGTFTLKIVGVLDGDTSVTAYNTLTVTID